MAATAAKNGLRSRMWCFTLQADESKGEHLQWPLANVRDPPLHWADKAKFKYMLYQVFFIVINGQVQRVSLGREGTRNREDPSSRLHLLHATSAPLGHKEEHQPDGPLGDSQGHSGPEHRVLQQEQDSDSRSV